MTTETIASKNKFFSHIITTDENGNELFHDFNVSEDMSEIRRMSRAFKRQAFKEARIAAKEMANKFGFSWRTRGIGYSVFCQPLPECTC